MMSKKEEPSSERLLIWQRIVASSLGGVLTSLSMTPFDVVKTRMQAQVKPQQFSGGQCFYYCNGLMDHLCLCAPENATRSIPWYRRKSQVKFNSTLDAVLKITRLEGPLALYSGLSATLVLAIPSTVLYFTSLDLIKTQMGYLPPHSIEGKQWVPPVAACCARVISTMCVSPLELIRTQMQAQPIGWIGIFNSMAADISSRGLLSLWRGAVPSLLRDVPFSAIYWFTFDSLRTWRLLSTNHSQLALQEAAGFGAVCGLVAGFTTLPFDVVKTHTQMELASGSIQRSVASTFASMRRIVKNGGVSGLYSGVGPRLLKVVPASAIMLGSFEFMKNYFCEQNRQQQQQQQH